MQMDRQSRVSLAKLYNINLEISGVESYKEDDGSVTYQVEVKATDSEGRVVSSIGLCNTKEVQPSDRPQHDAATIAETRAKNRATSELLDIEVEQPEESTEPITANQIKLIHILARNTIGEEAYHQYIKEKWGLSSTKELTESQARTVIDHLRSHMQTPETAGMPN